MDGTSMRKLQESWNQISGTNWNLLKPYYEEISPTLAVKFSHQKEITKPLATSKVCHLLDLRGLILSQGITYHGYYKHTATGLRKS